MMYHLLVIVALLSLTSTSSFTHSIQKLNRKFIIKNAMSPISQDILSSCAALGGSLVWLRIWIQLAKNGRIDPRLSRKIIHCGSAPLFICMWPFYSSDGLTSRAIAASIPLIQMGRLILAGTKSENSTYEAVDGAQTPVANELVTAISRSGSKSEALGGPLIYTIVLFLGTILFFRDSPIGVVAMTQMAAGDGIADIVGRRFGSVKWPFSEKKSYVGSAAFVLGAFVVCVALLSYLSATGSMGGIDVASKLPQILLISVLCALVELIPIGDDNVTVPIAAAALSWVLL